MAEKFFNDLKTGLEEVIAYKKGKLDLRSEEIELPEPPAKYKARDIKRIRQGNRYSQGVFSRILNVSIKTVQSWESGQRVPSHSALRLLELVEKGIYRPAIQKKHKVNLHRKP
ncbi:MAG TPA: XRE family transcriptional regulator [Candidatus Dependentiae bacterium]|jgi:putative transcriptional regulator|nr:XRE family transcriptional regulator [Candidatus Dependentiae bacterium]